MSTLLTEDVISKLEAADRASVFTHPNPDPDALGAATGMQWILKEKFGISADIYFTGEISHPQNRTMVATLAMNPLPFDTDLAEEALGFLVTVDCTPANCVLDAADLSVDHHKVSNKSKRGLMIVEQVGSASTLIVELIRELKLDLGDEIVATALMLGISIDTKDLTADTTTDRDYEAAEYLFRRVDRARMAKVIDYKYPLYFLEKQKFMHQNGNTSVKGACCIAFLGEITPKQRDVLPHLVDELIRVEGFETAVAFGITDGSLVEGCVRAVGSRDVNAFVKELFGERAGGKTGSGAGRVDLGYLDLQKLDGDDRLAAVRLLRNQVFRTVETMIDDG